MVFSDVSMKHSGPAWMNFDQIWSKSTQRLLITCLIMSHIGSSLFATKMTVDATTLSTLTQFIQFWYVWVLAHSMGHDVDIIMFRESCEAN